MHNPLMPTDTCIRISECPFGQNDNDHIYIFNIYTWYSDFMINWLQLDPNNGNEQK